MGTSIENPSKWVKVFDPIRGIKKQDRILAQSIEHTTPGEGKTTLEALAALNRIRRNPFVK